MTKITYHKSHTFIDKNDMKHSFITQLYKVGVYGILDNNSAFQGNFNPKDIRNMEKGLQKAVDNETIKSFELGTPITVTDKSGFWEEVK